MKKLLAVEGPLRGKTFPLEEKAEIGRGENCPIRLQGRHISRVHATVEKRGEEFVVRDHGSRNGIFVNGKAVKEIALHPGDQIEVGEHVLVYEPNGDAEKVVAAASVVLQTLSEPLKGDEKLLTAASRVAAAENEKEVAESLLDAATKAVAAERGFVLIAREGGRLRMVAKRGGEEGGEFGISNVIHHRLEVERCAVIGVDVCRRGEQAGSKMGVLAAPLAGRGGWMGLISLESKMKGERPSFTDADLRFVAALSVFAGARLGQLRQGADFSVGKRPLAELVKAFEKECLAEALRQTKGELNGAAEKLGLTRADFDEKLKAHGLLASAPPADWKSVKV